MTDKNNNNVVELNQVFFSYGKNLVLDNINLTVRRGDYLGVVGLNGAGKTTLLKIMLGLLAPTQGMVKLFGINIKDFKDYSKIAYVPQKVINFEGNFPLSVKEVVSMGRYARKGLFHHLQGDDQRLIKTALEQVKMWSFRQTLIGSLSGGQIQRVFIARALVGQPEIIFLDEPTTGVDQKAQDSFYSLLKELNKKMGLTLVLISHDTGRLIQEAGKIACLDHTLVYHNSPQEFLKDSSAVNFYGQQIKIITHHHRH